MNKIIQHVFDVLEWTQICEELKTRCAFTLGKTHIDKLNPLSPKESALRMSKIGVALTPKYIIRITKQVF